MPEGCLGCVSGHCVAHEGGLGVRCDTCRGSGRSQQLNPRGKYVAAMCMFCAGTGLKDAKRPVKKDKPVPVRDRPLMQAMCAEDVEVL